MKRSVFVVLCLSVLYNVDEYGVQSAPNHRIVGGAPADTKLYEFFALYEEDYVIIAFICGGSIIGKRTVLTAAHCCDTPIFEQPLNNTPISTTIRYGMSSYSASDGIKINVIGKKQHEEYDRYSFRNDIAILYVQKDVTGISYAVLPLQNEPLPSDGTDVRIIGYGTTKEDGELSNELLEVWVPIVNVDTCNENYNGDIKPGMFCAGIEGKDSCQGDSGGPAMDFFLKQIGITSWGIGCARRDRPGVYTYVGYYVRWIIDNSNFTALLPEIPSVTTPPLALPRLLP